MEEGFVTALSPLPAFLLKGLDKMSSPLLIIRIFWTPAFEFEIWLGAGG